MPRKSKHRIGVMLLKTLIIVTLWAGMGVAAILLYGAIGLPSVEDIESEQSKTHITILDRAGQIIARIGDDHGETVPYRAFPKHLIQAVVATEDRRFFEHSGVDLLGVARAMVINLSKGRVVQGGSTITQQLAKILFLTPERTFKRKVQELLLALQLERRFTKEEILGLYLNRTYLGAGNYGVSAAAHYYFDKDVSNLSLYESAVIAGLLKAPSRYAPTNNPVFTRARTHQVLMNMADAGYLTAKKLKKISNEHAKISFKKGPSLSHRYFADWVMEQVQEQMGSPIPSLIVRTTFDRGIQESAEHALGTLLKKEGEALNITQGAVLVMSPDGAVRAMIGGEDYRESQFNRATQAKRQPGSAFKPFIYLAAFENGLKLSDHMEDAPLRIGRWQPENFDGKYRGEISIREAITHSVNTVAIRVAQQVGMPKVVELAARLGINSRINKDLASALGASEVSLMELTTAYAHLANHGNAVLPYAIESIQTETGESIYSHADIGAVQVLESEVVIEMTNALRGVVEEGTGRAANIGRPAAGKTGTSQDFRDAWFLGYTPDLIAGVWVGNDDNEPMKKVTGGAIPARIWHEFMLAAHATIPAHDFTAGSKEWHEESTPTQESPTREREFPRETEDNPFWNQIFDWIKEQPKTTE